MSEFLYREEVNKGEVVTYFKSGLQTEGKHNSSWWSCTNKRNVFRLECVKFFQTVFLPKGYPSSVSPDYVDYQIWDTIQAFASSITGSLATYAVLEGVGVGDKEATALAAATTWLLKDGAGHVGRIVFAWIKGSELDSNSKQWRLFADVLNDVAICMDLFVNILPVSLRTILLCGSSVSRSMVSVAGGATRAALTQHQARCNNMADVSAKDGSQETLVNLFALIVNLMLLPLVTDSLWKVWAIFIVLTLLHLYSNYRAVTALLMDTFNRTRLHILMQHFLKNKTVLTVKEVNKLEPVLPGHNYFMKGSVVFGSSFKVIACNESSDVVESALDSLRVNNYYVYYFSNKVHVVLSRNADSQTSVEAYIKALVTLYQNKKEHQNGSLSDASIDKLLLLLEDHGWDLESNFLLPDLMGDFVQ